jgi:hypothetical protein
MRPLRTAAGLVALAACLGCQPRGTRTEATAPPAVAARERPAEPLPTYVCPRASGKIKVDGETTESAWKAAQATASFSQWNGEAAGSITTARLLWDDECLYVAFECEDPDIQGSMKQRDGSLWEQNEVVELFADADGDQGCYLEFEVNPLNTVVDLVIPKAGAPGPIEGKKMWDAKGMQTAVKIIPATTPASRQTWQVEMSIPFACFLDAPNTPPKPGDEWRINLYRVDAVRDQVEYQAWSPTNTETPSFHVPERFGVLLFE